MNNQWMKRTLLAVSIQFAIGSLYAAETNTEVDASAEAAVDQAVPAKEDVQINKDETKSLAPKSGSQAAEALQKKKVMLLRKPTYKKFLHPMNVSIP